MATDVDAPTAAANRRRAERAHTLRRARIIFDNRMSVFDCIIRDISTGGAKIEVPSPLGIPGHFELAEGAASHGHMCTVRWRADVALGVSFDDAQMQAA